MEVPVSLMEFLLQTEGSFGGFFCLKFYILRCFLGEQDFQSSFFSFLANKMRNSNVFLRMCFRMCFGECVSTKGLFQTFIRCNYCTQSIALSLKKIFMLEMVKNGVCFGSVSKQNALFSKKCAQNNAPMPSLSRIGHAFVR